MESQTINFDWMENIFRKREYYEIRYLALKILSKIKSLPTIKEYDYRENLLTFLVLNLPGIRVTSMLRFKRYLNKNPMLKNFFILFLDELTKSNPIN